MPSPVPTPPPHLFILIYNITRCIFFCIVLMVMAMQVTLAQGVGINATGAAPDSSAMLDIAATNRGLLLPRFNLSTTSFTPARPQSYLMVFDTVGTINAGSRFNTGRGLYFNAGTPAAPSWRRFLTSVDSTLFWGLRGNNSVVGDFIGTNTDQDFVIKTGSLATLGSAALQTKVTVPDLPNEDIVVSNVLSLRLPIGTPSLPSLRFVNTTLGLYGLNPSGVGAGIQGIGVRGGTNMHTAFSQNGVRITTSQPIDPASTYPVNSVLDVQGNILTRNKIVYQEYAGIIVSSVPERTFKNEIIWTDSIAPSTNGPIIFRDGNNLGEVQFRMIRGVPPADHYTLQITVVFPSIAPRSFVCNNTTVTINTLGTWENIGPTLTGPNQSELLIIKEQSRTNETVYRVHMLSANNTISVIIERWSN